MTEVSSINFFKLNDLYYWLNKIPYALTWDVKGHVTDEKSKTKQKPMRQVCSCFFVCVMFFFFLLFLNNGEPLEKRPILMFSFPQPSHGKEQILLLTTTRSALWNLSK